MTIKADAMLGETILNVIGWVLIIAGGITVGIAWFVDVGAATYGGYTARVVNVDLIARRELLFSTGALAVVSGWLAVAAAFVRRGISTLLPPDPPETNQRP